MYIENMKIPGIFCPMSFSHWLIWLAKKIQKEGSAQLRTTQKEMIITIPNSEKNNLLEVYVYINVGGLDHFYFSIYIWDNPSH